MKYSYEASSKPAGITVPSVEDFREIGEQSRVIPVVRRLLADGHTPLTVYSALAGERSGTFLLESAEHGHAWSRYSFIGVRASAMLTDVQGRAAWQGTIPQGIPAEGSAVDVLRDSLAVMHTPRFGGLPPLTSGFVGMIGYDAVRHWEKIPDANPDELGLPEVAMLLASDLAVFDHQDGSVLLVANAINVDNTDARIDEAYADAVARLNTMQADLTRDVHLPPATYADVTPTGVRARTAEAEYLEAVDVAKEHIRAGDAFQIVLSQRFDLDTSASAFDIYRVLRVLNPSPYMYLFRFGETPSTRSFDVIGSSPEALVKLSEGHALLHPIAGTRPRGSSPEHDAALADELLTDAKERAEHLMLVDLGRNDLGRVCQPGSVEVVEFMQIERYSHVMHIVSTVVGQLSPQRTAYDLLAATFPAGTLSGAPKPRAMEIIDALEPARRGLYAGCVGYLDFAGDMDAAIAIRTAVLKDGVAHVQAGAGIVADSDPMSEHQECHNKAAALLRSVAIAGTLQEVTVE